MLNLTFVTPLIADDFKQFQPLVLAEKLESFEEAREWLHHSWSVAHSETYERSGLALTLAYVWPDDQDIPEEDRWDTEVWKKYDPAQKLSIAVDARLNYLTHSFHVNQDAPRPRFERFLEEYVPVSSSGTLMQAKATDWELSETTLLTPTDSTVSSYSDVYLLFYQQLPALVEA